MTRPRPLLDPGTQVTAQIHGRTLCGVVQRYEQEHSWGTFPVEFSDRIWRTMTAADVTVLAPPTPDSQGAPVSPPALAGRCRR